MVHRLQRAPAHTRHHHLSIVQVALAAVVAATTKPVACFQCRPLAAGVRRGWLGRPLFLTPENQAQVDAARRGGFRHSSTALQGAAAAGAEVCIIADVSTSHFLGWGPIANRPCIHPPTSAPSITLTQLLGASKTTFASKEEYWEHLKSVGDLPQGFKVGTSWIAFTPQEANFPSLMNVTIIALDVLVAFRFGCRYTRGACVIVCACFLFGRLTTAPNTHSPQEPTDKFALALTRNAFPGAPIRVAKKRLDEPMIQAVVVNNKASAMLSSIVDAYIILGRKPHMNVHVRACVPYPQQISNVCPGGGGGDGGVGDAERVCEAVAKTMGLASGSLVLPSSTGVIGWRLPVQAIVDVVVGVWVAIHPSQCMPIPFTNKPTTNAQHAIDPHSQRSWGRCRAKASFRRPRASSPRTATRRCALPRWRAGAWWGSPRARA